MVWNKGMKGLVLDKNYSKHLIYNVPKEQHPSWKGGVQKTKRDGLYISIGKGAKIPMGRYVRIGHGNHWKKGMVIYHKDGNKLNNDISNLEAITRAELIKRNTMQ